MSNKINRVNRMGQWFSRKQPKTSLGAVFLPRQIKTLQRKISSMEREIKSLGTGNTNIEGLYSSQLNTLQATLNNAKKKSKVYKTLKTLRLVSGGKRRTRKLTK